MCFDSPQSDSCHVRCLLSSESPVPRFVLGYRFCGSHVSEPGAAAVYRYGHSGGVSFEADSSFTSLKPQARGGNIMHRCVACCVSCPVSNRHLAGRCGLMLTCQDRTLSAKSSFCDRFSSKIVALLFETAPVVEIWLKPDLSEFGTKPDLMRTPIQHPYLSQPRTLNPSSITTLP